MTPYIVQPGDSLSIIARDQLGDINRWGEIQTLNNILNPNIISVGEQLILPDVNPSDAGTVQQQAQTPAQTQSTTSTAKSKTPPPAAASSGLNIQYKIAIALGVLGVGFAIVNAVKNHKKKKAKA